MPRRGRPRRPPCSAPDVPPTFFSKLAGMCLSISLAASRLQVVISMEAWMDAILHINGFLTGYRRRNSSRYTIVSNPCQPSTVHAQFSSFSFVPDTRMHNCLMLYDLTRFMPPHVRCAELPQFHCHILRFLEVNVVQVLETSSTQSPAYRGSIRDPTFREM
jgi:hypothetical protein